MRRRRRALPAGERARLAESLAAALMRDLLLARRRRVACYVQNDGEMDPFPTVARLWETGRQPFLPALAGARLRFLPWHPETPLVANRFGIPEPAASPAAACPPRALDVVLMPLVAFDSRGHRLGMGGGFYDRTFGFLRHRSARRRPLLVGIAYGFQRVEALPPEPWDVPLAAVATEHGLTRFRGVAAAEPR